MKVTYNFCFENVEPEDGIKRRVHASRLENGHTCFQLATFNDGPDSEPFVTEMKLSKNMLMLLSSALHEAAHNMDQYSREDDGNDS